MEIKCGTIKGTYNKCCHEKELLFTQFSCEDKVKVPDAKPDVEEIVSVIVEPEIVSLRVINSPKGTSYEGQHLSGKKLSIEIKLKQKIMYISKSAVQSVHVVENECYKSTYIVIPYLIYGSKVEDLIKLKYLVPKIIVEGNFAEKIDDRTIFKNIILFIELKLYPIYVLCHSEDYNCNKSKLYIEYDDGTKKKEIAACDNCKILRPKWSPSGQKIGYICYDKYSSSLCITGISSRKVRKITDPYIFNAITSFSWGNNDNEIFFSAYLEGKKEIFYIDISTCQWKQLTYSKRGWKNFNVKISPNGNKVGYIKTMCDDSNLYIMNTHGLDTNKITSSGNVKYFDWQNDSTAVAYVSSKECGKGKQGNFCLGSMENGDEIYIIDISNLNKESIGISEEKLHIKNIRFSPDSRYIAFIGVRMGIENIYAYDLVKKIYIKIDNEFGVKIGDFAWNSESTQIYFSSNKLNYYNIYVFTICDETITQITNTSSNNIKLSYRPRII
ncbi:hypothetical protein [Clostridium ganghwense]|uniref:Uncharacterized protein n=1 Tax=Clostridium ganghwense TaxID=312089 RepID=A0ABT4CKF6_9CLOT|nr:hypothetical protein [Clostridium ganghwense]MCY6369535.1 hypothetical protein [Clostridium ganghwense]